MARSTVSDRDPQAEVAFPPADAPVASIIVLAWHLTDRLLNCLRSLRDSEDAPPFELVLVLNGADAGVRTHVAEEVRGAVIVDLDANVGYGGGCNAGALRSSGKYLILLNDDTVVEPRWLRTLVAGAEADPRIGGLATVLLNADGTVQEAGSRVTSGAGTLQFGAGLTPEAATKAGVLAGREIDYGSGAALLLRREAFEGVGGFDQKYEPAYFEDVDLCFRMRKAGWSVRLEPAARVMHLSGASTVNDRRFRTFAARRSGDVFKQRWAATLAAAPAPDAPLTAICDPRLSAVEDAPSAVRNPVPSLMIALGISADYRQWLLIQLDRAEEAAIREASLRETDAEEIRRLTEDAAHLRNRLEGLESAGPIGLVRWRLGIIRRRWARRRALRVIDERG
jgi:GT2 family glycosyltransferase